MGKGIYTYYKERLIEISGNNKCLCLKNVVRKGAYDIGRIFEGRDKKVAEFVEFIWSVDRFPLSLIGSHDNKEIVKTLGLPERSKTPPVVLDLTKEEAEKIKRKFDRQRLSDEQKIIEGEIARITELKREIEDIEKETGRYELFIGYPFVFGTIQQGSKKTLIKAPLLLFPVKIEVLDDGSIDLHRNEGERIKINPALIFAYAQSRKVNIDNLELEFDDLSQFKNVKSIIDYLGKHYIKIECNNSKGVYNFSRLKELEDYPELSVRYAAVMGRFPLSNSIYDDYTLLEKKNLTNDAINELLRTHKKKLIKATRRRKIKIRVKKEDLKNSYSVKMLDYAQSQVVRKVDEMGNMVIYGPPGTGKSQTIVNIITDAICKHKKVLVVSQKKAALDVVYSRLGVLNEKAMYVMDEAKEKGEFYAKCLDAHTKDMHTEASDIDSLQREYNDIQAKIDAEEAKLDKIYHILNDKRDFGLSLTEMYSSSYNLPKNSAEYSTYQKLIEHKDVMSLSYKEMSDALFVIKSKDLAKMYYSYVQSKEKNPLIDNMLPDVDIRTLSVVKGMLEDVQKSRRAFFNISKYPYYRQVLAHYTRMENKKTLHSVVKMTDKIENPHALFHSNTVKDLEAKFRDTYDAIRAYSQDYSFLTRIMTMDGYLAVIDNILRGNMGYLRLVHDAIDNYVAQRDVAMLMDSLDKNMHTILEFAYDNCRTYQHYLDIINSILLIRIYHEVLRYEEECKDELAKIVDFNNITSRIYKLKESQLTVANRLTASKNGDDYKTLFNNAPNNKDYLYEISKTSKLKPIRRMLDSYGDFIFSLFPCWLLSPENVSNLLPLKKNLFDLVIFDEASQVFIESTIPTIYRGKNIVVAGDAKQLRPSATFMKRYMGGDPEAIEDDSMAAALEVESLLDLAVARYESSNLTYHYRSKYNELIAFSNSAFYSSKLNVAPNTSGNKKDRPIERYKVNGKWLDRTNPVEAKKVAELLAEIFRTRKNNESIGIITFNSDQQTCIQDAIDRLARVDKEFRGAVAAERMRFDNGEDTSLFIKNLENVQGDERDIIIFSIGYAPNELGRVYTNFGALSSEGGENRLNVAITRAKSKIIVVTSIEPEELRVEGSKNLGPKLLKQYLTYVRAVSEGDDKSAESILVELDPSEKKSATAITDMMGVELQIKERLEKQGYTVHLGLGNKNNRITLAIYDPELDKYLVGVELDRDAYESSDSSMERDVYKPRFLEARGWNFIRIWCRDWWISPTKVIKTITNMADRNKKQ